MTSANRCARCAGRGRIPKFRYRKFAGFELCPACSGSGERYVLAESLREFRRRVIEGE